MAKSKEPTNGQAGKVAKHPPPFTEADTPKWLQRAMAKLPAPEGKAPLWLRVADLPPIRVSEHRLNDAQATALVQALRLSTVEEEHALVFALREYADRASLDAFVRGIRDQWNAAAAPEADLWVVNALACFELTE